jgi:hypothetical protein
MRSERIREDLRVVKPNEAENAARFAILRKATLLGFAALDNGDFVEFDNAETLRVYLKDLSERALQSLR